jgi:hypothetical protein
MNEIERVARAIALVDSENNWASRQGHAVAAIEALRGGDARSAPTWTDWPAVTKGYPVPEQCDRGRSMSEMVERVAKALFLHDGLKRPYVSSAPREAVM